LELEEAKDGPLAIVGGGPSLKYRWHELLGFDHILVLNGAYPFLVEKEITPEYFMMLDARKENKDFLRLAQKETRHFIAGQCDPGVFDSLEGFDTTLYLTILPETDEIVEGIDKPKHKIAGTVGTVGIKALCLAHALGYKDLHLFGYDSSHNGYHHAFPQALNDDSDTIEVIIEDKTYITSPTMANQSVEFVRMASGMVRMGFSIELHCDGLLPDLTAYSNKLGAIPLEEREKAKYMSMWEQPAYRKSAPGESHAEIALNLFETGTLIDFGCGTGRGAKIFQDHGYEVTGVDFSPNGLETEIPFVDACLWDLPDLKAEYGFCTDVMEHIPSEKVEEVLKGISRCCEKAYFNISIVDDSLGSLIGKKLHMTLMSPEGWRDLLSKHFKSVAILNVTKSDVSLLCSHG